MSRHFVWWYYGDRLLLDGVDVVAGVVAFFLPRSARRPPPPTKTSCQKPISTSQPRIPPSSFTEHQWLHQPSSSFHCWQHTSPFTSTTGRWWLPSSFIHSSYPPLLSSIAAKIQHRHGKNIVYSKSCHNAIIGNSSGSRPIPLDSEQWIHHCPFFFCYETHHRSSYSCWPRYILFINAVNCFNASAIAIFVVFHA